MSHCAREVRLIHLYFETILVLKI